VGRARPRARGPKHGAAQLAKRLPKLRDLRCGRTFLLLPRARHLLARRRLEQPRRTLADTLHPVRRRARHDVHGHRPPSSPVCNEEAKERTTDALDRPHEISPGPHDT
jgi:hypothetical protein